MGTREHHLSTLKLKYRVHHFLVCLTSSLLCVHLLKLARLVHQQHILISLLLHRMIYFTTRRPHSTNTFLALRSAPRTSGNVYDALFLIARSPSRGDKLPKTRRVQCQLKSNVLGFKTSKCRRVDLIVSSTRGR